MWHVYAQHSLFCSIPWWFPYWIFGILRFPDVFYDDPKFQSTWICSVMVFFAHAIFLSSSYSQLPPLFCRSLSHHQTDIFRTITWFWLHFTIDHFSNSVNARYNLYGNMWIQFKCTTNSSAFIGFISTGHVISDTDCVNRWFDASN